MRWDELNIWYIVLHIKDHFVHALSQWDMVLHCNIISHWLGAYTKWSLCMVYGAWGMGYEVWGMGMGYGVGLVMARLYIQILWLTFILVKNNGPIFYPVLLDLNFSHVITLLCYHVFRSTLHHYMFWNKQHQTSFRSTPISKDTLLLTSQWYFRSTLHQKTLSCQQH